MTNSLPELILAPILVACSTLVCRRWGARAGGVASALPAVVGPVLLITAQHHGAAFTARAANGTLLGLTTLAAFAVAYARMAGHVRWPIGLGTSWLCAAGVAVLVDRLSARLEFPGGLIVAAISLSAAYAALPDPAPRIREPADAAGGDEILLRMGLTAALVATLAAGATRLGPVLGGMLAALPVLASVLAVRTHRRNGGPMTVELLRGMLSGMSGFVGFCAVVAVLIVPLGTVAAFGMAAVSAITLQILVFNGGSIVDVLRSRRRQRQPTSRPEPAMSSETPG